MKADYTKKTEFVRYSYIFNTDHMEMRNLTNDGAGLCVCSNCFHFVCDEMLTGICPCCHYQFCPSLSTTKRNGRQLL